MSDGALELVCVFYVCVIHMDWHLSPYCWQPFSMLGEWTGVPLENDKVVAKDRSVHSLTPRQYLLINTA